MSESLSLTVFSAQEKRREKYADHGYGPNKFKVEVKHGGSVVLMAVVSVDRVQDIIALGIELAHDAAVGIDMAQAEYDAAEKDKHGRITEITN